MQPSVLCNRIGLPYKTLRLLFAKIRVTPSGCWEWMGAKQKEYGAVQIRGYAKGVLRAHRVFYELLHGPLSNAIHLHHEVENGCMGKACCNPHHLEQTTPVAHVMEFHPGNLAYVNAHKTHCKAGHKFTLETTAVRRNGDRQCRECDRLAHEAARIAKRGDRPKFKKTTPLKTHCLRGHARSDYGYEIPTESGPQWRCRECDKIRQQAYYDRKRGAAAPLDATDDERPDEHVGRLSQASQE